MKKIWQVWKEDILISNLGPVNSDIVIYEGSETNAKKYYKKNGGNKSGLHVGYLIVEEEIKNEFNSRICYE